MSAIVFYSETGQTRKYVNKIEGVSKIEITSDYYDVTMTEPFIIVIPSYEPNVHPIVIDTVADFIETGSNQVLCQGIFGGGNRNFAQLFCVTAKLIAEEYKLALLHEFEFQGTPSDVNKMIEELDRIEYTNQTKH